MLLLAPPSRRAHDVAISLRAPAGDRAVADRVAEEAMGCRCPAAVADRVRACILASGRYDCRVSFWIVRPEGLSALRSALAQIGGSVIVLDESGEPILEDEPHVVDTGMMRWSTRKRR